jgi:tRNA uridine 5-carboxymethylaminomethyl modification enzyme
MLNLGKGHAVHSLRTQVDRTAYHVYMKQVCESEPMLDIKQAEITETLTENGAENSKNNPKVTGLVTKLGTQYSVKAIVVATGTYLRGKVHVGHVSYASGPDASLPAIGLNESLEKFIPLRRFKTGTPCRVHRKSIDFSSLELQHGDAKIVPFSFSTNPKELINKVPCYISYTNEKTHEIIRRNLHKSAMFSGKIEGTGPRYCPSIEDKIVRFADKQRHQLFIEPMGENTDEFYLQGLSTSLPEDVQEQFLRTIKGLENVEIMRPAYAIEYDCCDPTGLLPTLEFKTVCGLFGAGQFCGSSGYEEAAAQGLVAGINAALFVLEKPQKIFPRTGSYIGTLIDDLVTKGCMDPYRMMTSRSEYRLILRQDNADLRLTPIGYEIGLVSEERYAQLLLKERLIKEEIERFSKITLPPSEGLNEYLQSVSTVITTGARLSELLRRPHVTYRGLEKFDTKKPDIAEHLAEAVHEQAEIQIKYEGYIKKQEDFAQSMKKQENRQIPDNIDYTKIQSLTLEAIEKLSKIRPKSVGQATRISGVTPADIGILTVYLKSIDNG